MKILIGTVVLLYSGPAVYSQSYLIDTYNENDGLANSMVHDIAQDTLGQMWFATRSGISVYDGFEWTSYSVSNGLPSNSYVRIRVDANGVVWALSNMPNEGISRFEGGHWDEVAAADSLFQLGRVSSFDVSSDGRRMVVGTENAGLFVSAADGWHHLDHERGLSSDQVRDVVFFEDRIYAATSGGLCLIDGDRIDTSMNRLLEDLSPGIIGIHVGREDNERDHLRIWLAGQDWLGFIEQDTFVEIARGLRLRLHRPFHTIRIHPDGYGGVFFGNEYAAYHFDKISRRIERLGADNGLVTEGCTSFYLDTEKNVWVGSLRGVNKISSMRFANYRSVHGLLDGEVTAILEYEPDRFVIGHNGGVTFFEEGSFRRFSFDDGDFIPDVENRVLALTQDSEGRIWAAVARRGVVHLREDGTFRVFNRPGNARLNITSIYADDGGRFWVTAHQGIYFFDDGTFRQIAGPDHLSVSFRRVMDGGERGMLFGSHRQGLFRFQGGRWTQSRSSVDPMKNSVYTSFVDDEGRIWVGTLAGLCLVQGDSIVAFTDGFRIQRPVYSIFEDSSGRIWFGTDNGAYRWDGKALRRFTVRDGFMGQECNRAAAIVDSRGRVWIGTDLGLSMYREDYDLDLDDVPTPRVLLEQLYVGGTSYDPGRSLRLRHSQHDLMFQYRAISYIDESRITYRCRMDGHDEGWRPGTPAFQRTIRYTNLPPGRYRFHAQARNVLGEWGAVASSETIVIERPFWSQGWFVALMVVIFLGIVYAVQSYISGLRYAARLEKQVEERTAQVQESLKEKELLLREVHHRVKNNFAVVSSLLNLQSNHVEDERTRRYLHESRDRIRSMALVHERLYRADNLTDIHFSDYIKTLTGELQRSHGSHLASVSFNLDLDDIPLSVDLAIPCGLIVNELITNALKYGFPDDFQGDGEVTVGLHRRDARSIELTVRDNGVGLPADLDVRDTGSLGLSLVFLLAESQLGGSVEVERDGGTTFRIRIDLPEAD